MVILIVCRIVPGGGGLVAKLCLTLETLLTVARQAPLSMGFSRQEYWSGLPLPSPTCVYLYYLFSLTTPLQDCKFPAVRDPWPVLPTDVFIVSIQGSASCAVS